MNTLELKKHMEEYIHSLAIQVNELVMDSSIMQEIKNSKMKPLVDKKKLILETMDSLDIIENKTYIPSCGMKFFS